MATYKTPPAKISVPLKLTPELKDRIEKQRLKENRSRNNFIEYAIKIYLGLTEK